MRLLFLNRSFWPDLESTGQFLTELCEDLSSEHEINVIAGPSYHIASKRKIPWHRESLRDIKVTRVWGTRLSKRLLFKRLVNLGSYYLGAVLAAMCQRKPDVVIAETDPPLLGALGALLKKRHGCRFIYNVHDVYPDIAVATRGVKSRFLLKLLELANRWAYECADLIVVLGEDMAALLIDKGVPAE
jgi:colanic acid biosynthesis glycosyl transferase WcaI